MKLKILSYGLISILTFSLAGCTFIFQSGRRSDTEKIEELSSQLDELAQAKKLLEEQLGQEIRDKEVSLQMMEKGLVITFVADILFDSGKATIKTDSYPTLNKVTSVLETNVPDFNIGIEGHTDNQPIKFSGWKSNWELSTARALSVLHYMVDKKGISPERVSAVGYGEHRPVASNDSLEGRHQNRRVEVVILPKYTESRQAREVKKAKKHKIELKEPTENLK
ncbi:MAG: OmpA family protein [Candidatus Omnitrophica bacterium]|nr:OmpA family protein [Candidatus Omnitrophota bacterium]